VHAFNAEILFIENFSFAQTLRQFTDNLNSYSFFFVVVGV